MPATFFKSFKVKPDADLGDKRFQPLTKLKSLFEGISPDRFAVNEAAAFTQKPSPLPIDDT